MKKIIYILLIIFLAFTASAQTVYYSQDYSNYPDTAQWDVYPTGSSDVITHTGDWHYYSSDNYDGVNIYQDSVMRSRTTWSNPNNVISSTVDLQTNSELWINLKAIDYEPEQPECGCPTTGADTVVIEVYAEEINGTGTITETYELLSRNRLDPHTPLTIDLSELYGEVNLEIRHKPYVNHNGEDVFKGIVYFYDMEISGTPCSNPTADISGGGNACISPVDINIDLTGSGPWSVTYEKPDGTQITESGITQSTYTFSTSEAGDYTLISVEDANCTGTVSGTANVGDCSTSDHDNDGVMDDVDCDKFDPDVGAPQTYYEDADGDGYGDPNVSQESCTQPDGYVDNNDDECPNNPDRWVADADCGCQTEEECNPTGIADPTHVKKQLAYPNPAVDVISIELDAKILNLQGNMVMELQKGTNDISHLPTGTYIIIAEKFSQRLIKK